MKQGTLILVPFPFTDLTSQKQRPALVISKAKNNGDYIVVAISSRKHTPAFPIETKDLRKGELPLLSYVRYDKVVTLNEEIFQRVVGELNPQVLRKIIQKFKALF